MVQYFAQHRTINQIKSKVFHRLSCATTDKSAVVKVRVHMCGRRRRRQRRGRVNNGNRSVGRQSLLLYAPLTLQSAADRSNIASTARFTTSSLLHVIRNMWIPHTAQRRAVHGRRSNQYFFCQAIQPPFLSDSSLFRPKTRL